MSYLARLAATALLLFTPFSLLADDLDLSAYRGKVVYVDFWASWCGPCAQSFPWMNKMQETYGKDGLVILAVNVDAERKLADAFTKLTKPNFTILYDPEGKLAESHKVLGMPSAFIYGREGKLRTKHIGWRAEQRETYEESIRALLAEKAQ